MNSGRPLSINYHALDDLIEEWIQPEPLTPEDKAMMSAYIAAHKKKLAAAEKRRAKREARKVGLIPKV